MPEERLGLVLLNNLDRTHMNLAASNAIVDHLLGLAPPRNWNNYVAEQVRKREEAVREHYQKLEAERRPGTRPSHELKAYTGRFDHPAYGIAEVSERNGQQFYIENLPGAGGILVLEHSPIDVPVDE